MHYSNFFTQIVYFTFSVLAITATSADHPQEANHKINFPSSSKKISHDYRDVPFMKRFKEVVAGYKKSITILVVVLLVVMILLILLVRSTTS